MQECENLCSNNPATCEYCKENYDVSTCMYTGRRPLNGTLVTGYLVRSKSSGEVRGILNKANHFAELAWVDEKSLRKCE